MKKAIIVCLCLAGIASAAVGQSVILSPQTATGITNSSATIIGTLVVPDTAYVYATMQGGSYISDTLMITQVNQAVPINVVVSSLSANTTYSQVRLCVSVGTNTVCSSTGSFTTLFPAQHAVVTVQHNAVTTTAQTATIPFTYQFGYGASTEVRVYWGFTANNLVNSTAPLVLTNTGATSIGVQGLLPGTQVFYRLESLSQYAITASPTYSFVTPSVLHSTISCSASPSVTSASLSYQVSLGSASVASVSGSVFQGQTLVQSFPSVSITTSSGGSQTATGLTPNTVYRYRTIVQDVFGADTSEVLFTTLSVPAPTVSCTAGSITFESTVITVTASPGSTYPGTTITKFLLIKNGVVIDSITGLWNMQTTQTFTLAGLSAGQAHLYSVHVYNSAGSVGTCMSTFTTLPAPAPPQSVMGSPATGACTVTLPVTLAQTSGNSVAYLMWRATPTGVFTNSTLLCSPCTSGTYSATAENLLAETQYWFRTKQWTVPQAVAYSNTVTAVTQIGSEPSVIITNVFPNQNGGFSIHFNASGNGYETHVSAEVYTVASGMLVANPSTTIGTCQKTGILETGPLSSCLLHDIAVIATNQRGEEQHTRMNVLSGCANIAEPNEVVSFYLLPNPATDMVTLAGVQQEFVRSIHVIDVKGSIVHATQQTSFSVESLPSGIYFVSVEMADKAPVVLRMLKQ